MTKRQRRIRNKTLAFTSAAALAVCCFALLDAPAGFVILATYCLIMGGILANDNLRSGK